MERERLIQRWTFDVQCSMFWFQAIEIEIGIGIEKPSISTTYI